MIAQLPTGCRRDAMRVGVMTLGNLIDLALPFNICNVQFGFFSPLLLSAFLLLFFSLASPFHMCIAQGPGNG